MLFLKRFNLVFPKSYKGLLLSGYRIVIDGLNIEARGDNIKEFFFTDEGAYCSWFLDMLPTIDSVNLKYYEQTLPSIFLFIAFIKMLLHFRGHIPFESLTLVLLLQLILL